MRGERGRSLRFPKRPGGSSPHARGTLDETKAGGVNRRFIPACAGNAVNVVARRRQPAVHPRMRGERRSTAFTAFLRCGSSPHARGTRQLLRQWGKRKRFIPACAGNAPRFAVSRPPVSVHPRMRGERDGDPNSADWRHGSSPHARGTRELVGCEQRAQRFIPACAGNAMGQECDAEHPAVHPRMRGERALAVAVIG